MLHVPSLCFKTSFYTRKSFSLWRFIRKCTLMWKIIIDLCNFIFKEIITRWLAGISYFDSLGRIFFCLKNVFSIEELSTTLTLTSIESVSLVWTFTSKRSLCLEGNLQFAPTATIHPNIFQTKKGKLRSYLLSRLIIGLYRHKKEMLV